MKDPLGRPPARLLVPAALATLLLLVPLVALVVSTPWSLLGEQLASRDLRLALWLSVLTATVAMLVCLVIGLPLAWVLARLEFPGRGLLRALVTVPLVLPPVAAGVALMAAFGRNGLVGAPLRELTGLTLPYSTAGVVLAHTFVSLPFVVLAIEGALRSARKEYDAAAATLGATRWWAFRTVTVPLAMPGILAGMMLGWARSIGEFGATITFAGNYPGTTQTMPSLIYVSMNSNPEAARSLALVLLVFSVAVLVLLRDRWLATP
ncbi:ABC transporter permease [Nocardioides sp. AE5]|uniref:ABC transporter permease n=1 Tax=Nocardioides sp. AE5 TaxID=2962573 RepID=UPI002881C7B3|nr:ABC transporter permease [Nocardioides sp. AE5]MDT0202175.1 ABC transporter permease [Nocardioides sp. AE5]